jgi:AraC family transcriptional regulator
MLERNHYRRRDFAIASVVARALDSRPMSTSAARAIAALDRGSRATRPQLRGAVHLWSDGVAYIGGDYYATPHERFAASLCIATDGPFRARYGDTRTWSRWYGSLVAPNARREVDTRGASVVFLLLDPESDTYARLAHLVGRGTPAYRVPDAIARRLAKLANDMLSTSQFDAVRFRDACLDALGSGVASAPAIDARVRHVLSMLKSSLPEIPSLRQLAAAVDLSESRFTCLFNETMGLSLRRYVQWLRLRHVAFCIAIGQTLTTAAHDAGFADLAHLSRTFRSMFGLPISTFFGSATPVELLMRFSPDPVEGPHAPQDRERWAQAARVLGAASAAENPLARRMRPRRRSQYVK